MFACVLYVCIVCEKMRIKTLETQSQELKDERLNHERD